MADIPIDRFALTGTLVSTVLDCILLYSTVMALSCEIPELKCKLTSIFSSVMKALYCREMYVTNPLVMLPEPVRDLFQNMSF